MSTASHSPALWTLGFAALALSGFSLWSSLADPAEPAKTMTNLQEENNNRVTAALTRIEGNQADLVAKVESLQARLEGLENSSRRTQVQLSNEISDKDEPTGTATDAAVGAIDNPAPKMDKKTFAVLLEKMIHDAGTATPEEQATFWKLARTTTMIDDHIKDLLAAVEASPGDADKKLALADAYVAKLMTVPDGPERGTYAILAENQWKNILEKDPTHWQAQISLAFSHSQYPDFMNMTGKAVEDFEKVLAIQERQPQEKKFAVTYSQLALLYRKQGKSEKALTLLREGNRRFPKDGAILQQLKELQGK